MVGKHDGQPKYSQKYVKLLAQFHVKNDDGTSTFIDLPFKDCTDDDLDRFEILDDVSSAEIRTFENDVGF